MKNTKKTENSNAICPDKQTELYLSFMDGAMIDTHNHVRQFVEALIPLILSVMESAAEFNEKGKIGAEKKKFTNKLQRVLANGLQQAIFSGTIGQMFGLPLDIKKCWVDKKDYDPAPDILQLISGRKDKNSTKKGK